MASSRCFNCWNSLNLMPAAKKTGHFYRVTIVFLFQKTISRQSAEEESRDWLPEERSCSAVWCYSFVSTLSSTVINCVATDGYVTSSAYIVQMAVLKEEIFCVFDSHTFKQIHKLAGSGYLQHNGDTPDSVHRGHHNQQKWKLPVAALINNVKVVELQSNMYPLTCSTLSLYILHLHILPSALIWTTVFLYVTM